MATTTKINITPADSGVLGKSLNPESASKATQLLQDDMEKHHIFFNNEGFHNHLVHEILSIIALGASPEDVQRGYDRNTTYQLPAKSVNENVVKKLRNRDFFRAHAGKRDNYSDFLVFFQREIDAKGVGPVTNEYLFAGDDFADEMLIRLFAGVLHPLIHLGFGFEFNQPAIVAQAIAQTAVHDTRLASYLVPAEKAAEAAGRPGNKPLVQILAEMRADPDMKKAARWEDPNKFDGVLNRAREKMIQYASQFTVNPDQIDQRLAEMINAVVYFTGAAQNPPKIIKFDFFYMHCVNSSIFLPTFLAQPWLSTRAKIRLMEWKARMDLFVYVSRGCVEPRLDEIRKHIPERSWQDVFSDAISHRRDDGHLAKFVRLLAYGEKICRPFEGREEFPITGDMWLKLGDLVIDATSGPESMWLMSAGFPEAWKEVPERVRL